MARSSSARTWARPSPAYQQGPYSPYTEELVEKFMSWYFKRLRAETGLGAGATVSSLAASG